MTACLTCHGTGKSGSIAFALCGVCGGSGRAPEPTNDLPASDFELPTWLRLYADTQRKLGHGIASCQLVAAADTIERLRGGLSASGVARLRAALEAVVVDLPTYGRHVRLRAALALLDAATAAPVEAEQP